MLNVTLYAPGQPGLEPPHKPVFDAYRPSESGPLEARVTLHQQRMADGEEDPYRFICACCDWKHPDVKKARGKKKKALDRFLRTGKLPPMKLSKGLGVSRIPKALSDEEAGRVVLPLPSCKYKSCTDGVRLLPEDVTIERACSRYLEAMGETRRDGGDTRTCGCVITSTYGDQHCQPCERHRGAFEGTGGDK